MAKQPTSNYTLSGTITNQAGEPLAKLIVKAFDQDPSGENPLGKATTDEKGSYQITYTDANFRIKGKESGGPDIIVRVYEGDQLLKATKPKRNAGQKEEINVAVDKFAEPLLSPELAKQLSALLLAFKGKKQQETFTEAFVAAKGDWTAVREEIGKQKGFGEKTLEQLDFTHQLADLTNNHVSLIEAFHTNHDTNSLNDVAKVFDRTKLTDLVESKGVPDGLEAQNYAAGVYEKLFHAAPTALLSRMASNPAESPIADKVLSGSVATFLDNQPDFNIKTNSIYEALKVEKPFKGIAPELHDKVIVQLKVLQRVAALSPVPEAMSVLMQRGITSALWISDMSSGQFVRQVAQALGEGGEKIARQIHTNAVNTRIRNEQTLMAIKELGRGTGVDFIDKSVYARKQTMATRSVQPGVAAPLIYEDPRELLKINLPKRNLSWELLFDDADFCECGDCNSVYSPAAYFVDLLQYLRNNNIDNEATGPIQPKKGISGTPLKKLFDRRPDLGCLQLTCKNAFTILPYIDLVNEVLEHYVVFKEQKPFNVEEDETSSELLAQPQHTEYEAYCILHKTKFPFTLPYHQPIDAARIFLGYLGTSRYELIDKFRSLRKEKMEPADGDVLESAPNTDTAVEKAELDKLHEDYLQRAADAEYLGLTQEEYVILTQEAFVSKAYWDKQCKKEHALEAYLAKIDWKPTHEYYGYDKDKEGDMLSADETKKLGLAFVEDQFLRRTGIEYQDLVELLKTRCLNPNLPKGKALSILQSIQFSYQYLQSLVVEDASTPKGKYEKVVTFLTQIQPLIPLLEASANPDPCTPKKDTCVETKDLEQWVNCYFEKIGKVIVLESGEKPTLTVFGDLHKPIVYGTTTAYTSGGEKAGSLTKDGSLLNLNGKQIGKVNYDEQVYDLQGDQFPENYHIKNAKGELVGGIADGKLIISDQEISIWQLPKENCDLNKVRLQHLDGSSLTEKEYGHIHRFIRLWRKLGWTIDETDQALIGLGDAADNCQGELMPETAPCDDLFVGADNCGPEGREDDCFDATHLTGSSCDITPAFLHELVAVKKLAEKTGLELIKLLAFWTDISTAGEKSLYKRLFLTHNLIRVDDVLQADKNGNYLSKEAKITEHLPILMAAFNLSADDIAAIMDEAKMDDKLTLGNLSTLYRYRLLAKVLGLKMPAFVSILPLFGDVFNQAHITLEFVERWGKMEDAGFSYRQLNYIIQGYNDLKKPLAPSEKTILKLTKTLYDGLNDIDLAHKDLAANPETTDLVLKDLEIQAQASPETVRSKATLLYAPSVVEQIVEILEGTSVFTTNAPENLDLSLADDKSLKKKLKYDKTGGTVQVTGILTDAESIDYKALSNHPKWAEALSRIKKQQSKLYKVVLSDVFESEKAQSAERKTEVESAEKLIQSGDISIAFDQIRKGQEDTNTAPKKRVAFLQVFLPYLRQQLTHRFIVDTLAGQTGLERETTDVLISDILTIGNPAQSVYAIFEAVKESAKLQANAWSGYLIPPAEMPYTIIVKSSDTQPVLTLDGQAIKFEQQEDPTNEWWSDPQPLQPGKLYQLAVTGVDLKNVYWKTPTSSISPLPPAVLLPDFASDACSPAFIALKKAAILVTNFILSADELRYLHVHKADFGGLDLNQLTLEQWLRLEAYTRLRNALPPTKTNILKFFEWTHQPDDAAQLSTRIAELTLWKKERINQLIAETHFNLDRPEAFRNEENLLKLQKALEIADKIGMDIDLLFDWAKPTSNFKKCRQIAESIQKAIRAKYKQEDWEQVVKPLNDKLRGHQRNALIAYLLQQPELIKWGVTDVDGLFEYFLIDVQMEPCMETSRIKQALSSVQLFVQRCFLGLEEEYNQITPNTLDRDRWDWMQRYRVWEANRKVFLYPENWIESNLRDDKSPFFQELESELLQKDINQQSVEDALKAYLYKVDEVANMQVVGLYVDEKNQKLHVFSRTRNAPFFFYYRYFALDEKNWYPWEKMQVDIPSYDVENKDSETIGNGCYLTPVVWNGRLLVFFPQIVKKTKPNDALQKKKIEDTAKNNTPEDLKPIEYYEIKMAWSEYRNGKWTQKQISTDVVNTKTRDDKHDIQYFKFVPVVNAVKVVINVDDYHDQDGYYLEAFEFDGARTRKRAQISTESIPIELFHHDSSKKIYSWQISDAPQRTRVNKSIYFSEDSSGELSTGIHEKDEAFHHPDIKKFLGKLNAESLSEFFDFSSDRIEYGTFDHDNNSATLPIYQELKRPYSLYNWEIFFHTPMMLADALSKAQQFEEAMKWYHFVFSPTAEGTDDKRFWQFRPFKEIDAQHILEQIFNNLESNKSNGAISEWRNHPFKPHLVARSRPVAYMKWVVMKYIDNLIAWGDYLFRQDTIESINQATQLYVLAGHILGPRPQMIPKRGKIKPQTYLSLLDKWDAFSNAMVELELVAPYSNQTTLPIGIQNGVVGFANVFGFATSLYFCIPNNPKLMGYWDTIADRLYKIRHCLNYQGVFRKLALYEPPIDPALLVKAAAQGLSISSVLNDLNTSMPNYRFYYLLQKSLELCSELKSLGGALLSAMEKKDNETLSLIRAKHESVMQNLVMEIRKQQLEEAQKALDGLQQNRKSPEHRMKYYLQLIGEDAGKVPGFKGDFNELANAIEVPVDEGGLRLNRYESAEMNWSNAVIFSQIAAASSKTLAAIFAPIPDLHIYAALFGTGPASKVTGGQKLSKATSITADVIQIAASILSHQASNASKKGSFLRALQERTMQANAAGHEIKQIDKQITGQQIRIQIAEQEMKNQQKQIDNAQEIEEFLKNKYTNEELYVWTKNSLSTLYHQVYSLAYELAKKAEKVFRFERGLSNSNFIQSGYWDAGRNGLLAGDQLYVALKQLEAAYQEQRGYDYEITKHISLRQINPIAVLQLKETGKCEFDLPEVLFDMDYPGHYKRRIKSVSVSVPCVVGPYTGINANLRLLEHKFRISNIAKDKTNYLEKIEELDDRFMTCNVPITAIAASTAQNDSGMFELNFKDERYLPFEGAGVTSRWRLELPTFRQFDYDTISDVVVHMRYTSVEGGERLKKAAGDSVYDFIKTTEELGQQEGLFAVIDLKHDLPNEWNKAMQVAAGDTARTMDIDAQAFLPYFIKLDKSGKIRDLKKVSITDAVLLTHSNSQLTEVSIKQADYEYSLTDGAPIGLAKSFVLRDEEIMVDNWKLIIKGVKKPIDKAILVVRFVVK